MDINLRNNDTTVTDSFETLADQIKYMAAYSVVQQTRGKQGDGGGEAGATVGVEKELTEDFHAHHRVLRWQHEACAAGGEERV